MKRRKNEQTDGSDYEGSTDRLSDLPESLIVQILSLLPIEEAVRTGVLCTRWKHLWKHVNKVVLEYLVYHLPPEEQTNFISFIDHTLMQCVCAKTISLYSVIALDEVNSHSLHNLFDRLIQQFYSQKVESLKVRFERFNYAPPEWFYHNSTMVKLDISNWTLLALPAVVSWNFLRSLSLGALAIGDEQFAKILSGCPVLVDLDLLDIRSTNNNIKIMSQSLLKLSVSYEWFHEQDEVLLEINAPRLQFLRFFGGFYNVDVCFVNVSSLVHANLNYDTDDDMRIYLAIELLKSLHHVPELTIGEDFISALSFLKLSGQPCPLLNWKRVTFIISVFKEELLGLTHLLKNSCSLETLSIEFRKYEKDECRYDIEEMYDFEASTYLSVESGDFPHLKSIEVTYCYCENDLGEEDRATFVFEFVAYILRQAHVLEKLVIAPQEECCKCSRNCPLLTGECDFGSKTPELTNFVVRVLSLTCSSFGCERNRSTFERIYTKLRNRLEHKRLNVLVYAMYNTRLRERSIKGKTENIELITIDEIDSDDEWVAEKEDHVFPYDASWTDDENLFAVDAIRHIPVATYDREGCSQSPVCVNSNTTPSPQREGCSQSHVSLDPNATLSSQRKKRKIDSGKGKKASFLVDEDTDT